MANLKVTNKDLGVHPPIVVYNMVNSLLAKRASAVICTSSLLRGN